MSRERARREVEPGGGATADRPGPAPGRVTRTAGLAGPAPGGEDRGPSVRPGPARAPSLDDWGAPPEEIAAREAMDRASGRALERPQAESIEEHRATLSLDAEDEPAYERIVYGEETSPLIDLGEATAAPRPAAPRPAAPRRPRRRRAAPPALAAGDGRDEPARIRRAARGHRLEVAPDEVRLTAEVGATAGPIPVHLVNHGDEPVAVAGFHHDVEEHPPGPRPPGDFVVQGGPPAAPIPPGGAAAFNVTFQPQSIYPDDGARVTSRTVVLQILDDAGRWAAKVRLRGMARPASSNLREWRALATVEQSARGGAVARPETVAEMIRHLHAAESLLQDGDRAAALALVEAVHDRLEEAMPPGRAQRLFARYGMGQTTALLTTGFAKTHVDTLWRQLRSGATVEGALARMHVTTFELAAEPLRELTGETTESSTIRAMHTSSPLAPLADTMVDFFSDATFAGGFTVGVVQGAYSAAADVLGGAKELLAGIVDVVQALIADGLVDAAIGTARKVGAFFESAPAALRQLGARFEAQWHAEDSYDRGNFRGEVVGYVVTQLAVIIASGGTVAAALAAGGKWGPILAVVRAADAAGDVFTYARQAGRVLGKLRGKLGKPAGAAGDAADEAGDAARRADRDLDGSTPPSVATNVPPANAPPASTAVVLAGDDATEIRLAAKAVQPIVGTLDVFIHGTVDEFGVVIGGTEVILDHRRLAAYIRKSAGDVRRVRLFSCRTGAHPEGAAQHLSNKLGVEVIAPSDKVFVRPNGEIVIGPAESDPSGHWVSFKPSSSRLRMVPVADPVEPTRAIDRYRATRGGGETADAGAVRLDEEPSRHVSAQGFAQAPRLKWRENPGGVRRSLDEVAALAEANGVEFPEEINFSAVAKKYLPKDTYAKYGDGSTRDPDKVIYWSEFLDEHDRLSVTLSEEILSSDEAIVAVVAHEMHELNSLKKLFDARDGGGMTVRELRYLVTPGRLRNLHDEAWDAADQVVARMRRNIGESP
jgi:hypothetical protein